MVNLKNAHDKNCPFTLSYHNFQLQALPVHCPISAQVRLVLITFKNFVTVLITCVIPQVPMIEEQKITINP